MKPELSVRQTQVAGCVARGLSDKRIATEIGLSVKTVQVHIQAAAAKLPGQSTPRHRIFLWYFGINEEDVA